MKNLLLLLLFLGGTLTNYSCNPTEENPTTTAERPNIVLIITDDQGWGDLGFHGNPDIKTPVLDSFARQSTRLSTFYVSPVCAPTRSSLMTGRYSLRTGVYDTYNGGAIMSPEEVTLAELLQQNGYRTGMFGKWHLGDNYPSRPQDQGFEQVLMHRSGGMAQVGDVTTYFRFDSAYFDPVLLENGQEVQKQGYCSDIYTDAAIDFIENHQDEPFFTYLSFNAPHTPLQLPQEYYELYADLEIDSTRYPDSERPFPEMNDRNVEDARRVYGMVTNIDDNLRKLFQKLDELALTENTLVIFMTDNGPQQSRYVGGFRGRKGSVYEGGVRVPFFVRFPKQLEADVERTVPAAHIDVLPTLLDVCGVQQPDNLDGKSLLPVLNGESVDWAERPLFFYWQRGFEHPYRNVAVRQGDYKLVGQNDYLATASDLELFNLADDPSELHNLSKQELAKAEELKATFDDFYREVIQSPHLQSNTIILGNAAENPSVLNRNDAKGNWGVWSDDEIYAYWDVETETEGVYDFDLVFRDTLKSPGRLTLKVGRIQRTIDNERVTQNLQLPEVFLPKGQYMLEAVYQESEGQRRKLFPFYVSVERKMNTDEME